MSRPIESIQFPLRSVELEPQRRGVLRRVAVALAGYWRNWRTRRALRALAGYSSRELADIGINRSDVVAALMTPLTQNPGGVLSVRAAANRAAEQARLREAVLERRTIARHG